ncbi:MAG: hypothetical protein AAGA56_22380 [Myxococcota bacterium]
MSETELRYDATGWAEWPEVAAWPRREAWTLFVPDPSSRMNAARWSQQAKRFFRATAALSPEKSYEGGTPRRDRAEFWLEQAPHPATVVAVQTIPLDDAPALLADAERAADAMGGAGMDRLLKRATRIWQLRARDDRGAKLAAALLASIYLGPCLPPEEDILVGVRGMRLRLDGP